MSLPCPHKPRQAPGVVTSEVLDELIAYVPAKAQAIAMNASARAVWELCDGTRTLNDICEELAEPAGMTAQALRDDVRSALDQLGRLGLLVSNGP